jgi:hypothetical protein
VNFVRYFSEKNAPNAKKYSPKRRNFAQSGHTAYNPSGGCDMVLDEVCIYSNVLTLTIEKL